MSFRHGSHGRHGRYGRHGCDGNELLFPSLSKSSLLMANLWTYSSLFLSKIYFYCILNFPSFLSKLCLSGKSVNLRLILFLFST